MLKPHPGRTFLWSALSDRVIGQRFAVARLLLLEEEQQRQLRRKQAEGRKVGPFGAYTDIKVS